MKTLDQRLANAYLEGEKASAYNYSIDANPYSITDSCHYAWLDGFYTELKNYNLGLD